MFLNNKSYFSSILVEALKTAKIPTIKSIKTGKKTHLSNTKFFFSYRKHFFISLFVNFLKALPLSSKFLN